MTRLSCTMLRSTAVAAAARACDSLSFEEAGYGIRRANDSKRPHTHLQSLCGPGADSYLLLQLADETLLMNKTNREFVYNVGRIECMRMECMTMMERKIPVKVISRRNTRHLRCQCLSICILSESALLKLLLRKLVGGRLGGSGRLVAARRDVSGGKC